jgi:hypothetical protein
MERLIQNYAKRAAPFIKNHIIKNDQNNDNVVTGTKERSTPG